jgi:hypothetical protein
MSEIDQVRGRAKKLGYRLHRKRGKYQLLDSDGLMGRRETLDGVSEWLNSLEGKTAVQIDTGIGPPISTFINKNKGA